MHKTLIFAAVCTAGMIALLSYSAVQAADDTTLSDEQLQTVRNNCITLKGTLDQLNYNDTALRVNQGQYYVEISTKLMAPMNSRISLNHYDGSDLVSIAADFSKEISTFRARYTAYAKALNVARNDNCGDHPQGFYDDIVQARKERQSLHRSVEKLNGMVKDYRKTFSDFAKTLPDKGVGISK